MRSCMSALLVTLADFAHSEQTLAEETINESRLTRARRTEESDRPTFLQVIVQRFQSGTCQTAYQSDRHSDGDPLDFGLRTLAINSQVNLGQKDDRHGSALPCQSQIPFDSPQAERLIECVGNADEIDVGGDHLLLGTAPSHLPRETQ